MTLPVGWWVKKGTLNNSEDIWWYLWIETGGRAPLIREGKRRTEIKDIV